MEPQSGSLQGVWLWRRVTALLDGSGGGDGMPRLGQERLEAVAAATLTASIEGLERAKGDEGVVFTFFLLARVVRASREPDFVAELEKLGFGPPPAVVHDPNLKVPDPRLLAADLHELLAGFVHCGDRHVRAVDGPTPASEMAQRAATQSLIALCAERSLTLFGSSEETVIGALRPLTTACGFGRLSKHFLGRLIREHILYYLSKELTTHHGDARHFAVIGDHFGFQRDLDDHCQRAAEAVRGRAQRWYARHRHLGGIRQETVGRFVGRAVDDMREAMRYREGRDGG